MNETHTFHCRYEEDDQIAVRPSDGEVVFFPSGGSVYLSPKKAKKLAKAIKAAAKQAKAARKES